MFLFLCSFQDDLGLASVSKSHGHSGEREQLKARRWGELNFSISHQADNPRKKGALFFPYLLPRGIYIKFLLKLYFGVFSTSPLKSVTEAQSPVTSG